VVLFLNVLREIDEDQTNTVTIKETSSHNLFWDSRIRNRGTLFKILDILVDIRTWNLPTTCL
jgi:hypothetical protein